ncbi:MAG: hypothetical protein WCV70_00370 [Patescibacteria group bacterium]|jgi:hypothetical protein
MPEISGVTRYRMQKLVAVVFIGCLLAIFLSGFDVIKSKVRDIKRRADIKILIKALDLYHDKYGQYPDSADDWQGWDISISYNKGEEDFLSILRKEGLIDRPVRDPINNDLYYYRYQNFSAGEFGCQNSFYILQASNFELPTNNNGAGQCLEFNWAQLMPNGYTAQNFN